jgi:predicted nucleic acid-binding protein
LNTAVDTNILVSLWNPDDSLNLQAERALTSASQRGRLSITGLVYVEIRAMPERSEQAIDRFLEDVGIDVDWMMEERIWREAAKAAHEYGQRRRQDSEAKLPRRIAGDFVIGAYALVRGYSLLTLDRRTFRAAFPSLRIAAESS